MYRKNIAFAPLFTQVKSRMAEAVLVGSTDILNPDGTDGGSVDGVDIFYKARNYFFENMLPVKLSISTVYFKAM